MTRELSDKLFDEAQKLLVGGVNSPVRAFRAVGGHPFFVRRAKGSSVLDVDGNEYIDYVGSWGPMILGHAHTAVVRAIQETARDGTSFGIPNPLEIKLAQLITAAFPSIEKIRFTSSGTEATMSAIRLARGFTGRDLIVKFEGHYHGHADSLLVKAGSGATTFGQPDSAGVPAELAKLTLTMPFNNREAVNKMFAKHKKKIAAVIVEPVCANAGLILPACAAIAAPSRRRPEDGFLKFLREITTKHGTLLIFDEVVTGFRLAYGGAQKYYGLKADMTTLGKIIGGGLPVGAFGGRADIMDQLAPLGPVYQAGTLSGNPLAMAAGIATLETLNGVNTQHSTLNAQLPVGQLRPAGSTYDRLETMTKELADGLRTEAKKAKVAVQVNQVASMLTVFFTAKQVTDYASAKTSDTKRFAKYFNALLEEGIYWPPSQFETAFVSLAHTEQDIEKTIAAARESFQSL